MVDLVDAKITSKGLWHVLRNLYIPENEIRKGRPTMQLKTLREDQDAPDSKDLLVVS